MRRLLRWTFHALAAASLLLCLATAGLWVEYWVHDELQVRRVSHMLCNVSSARGQFDVVFLWSERPEDDPKPPWEFEIEHPIGSDVNYRIAGHRPIPSQKLDSINRNVY